MNLLWLNSARSRQLGPRRGPIRRRGISFEFLESRTLLSSGLNVGMNLGFIKPYATDDPFANVMEMAYPSWNVTSALRPAIAPPLTVPMPPLDGNGYPIGLGNLPAQGDAMYTEVFLQNGQHYPTGTYTLTFDGSGTVAINDSHDPIQTFTQGGGIGQPHNVTISGTAALGIVIAITSSNPSDYVRNIRLVMPGLQNTYQTQPFNPQYLSGLQSFSTLRFLDPMLPNITSSTTSNGQSGELTWSERTPPTYFTQAVSSGMSVEYMVDLCNALHENMWVTMPVNADNNYELNFAQYVEENLDPGLKVYVEYGNEIWNSTYSYEYNTVISYATAHGLNQPQAMADLSTNCWNVWLQVFAGQTDRMARVVASQFSVPWMFNEEIARLVATSRPTDPDHGFDVIAGAGYFSPDTSSFNAQTTVQQYEAAEMAALTGKFTQQLLNFTAMRNSWEAQLNQNIPVIMYEGGTGQSAHGSPPWYNTYVAAQTDPGQFAVIMAYLNELQDAGVTGVEYFNFIGLPSQWGEYGSMDYLGEPSNLTPKYNALVDFINPQSLAIIGTPREDTTTQGNWIGTYGTQGYDVIGDTPSLPSYATIAASGELTETWATSSTAPQALQNPGGSGRIEAAWYSATRFTVSLNLTDGKVHDIELYALDLQSSPSRVEQIQISDAATGAVLGTETLSSFTDGAYLNWRVEGDVAITITREAGANAVLSGIFIDPLTLTSSAAFVKEDTTTQGTWMGSYGSDGYDIIDGPSSLPSYATVTVARNSTYEWSADTTDVCGLENPSSASPSTHRIAAVWYAFSSFTIDVNLTDGQAHQIALYALDWDQLGRSETITITNASTGAVLSTETLSSFTNGAYLVWTVSGDVEITITALAGSNAVLNGLFFQPNSPTPSLTPTATATFAKTDTTTQGTWLNPRAYGADGYNVAGATTKNPSYPAYATVTASGSSTYTWSANTTDALRSRIPAAPVGSPPPGIRPPTSRWTSTRPTARPTRSPSTHSTGTSAGGARRSRSPTRPPGPCWIPRRSRRSATACMRSGPSAGT